MLNEIEEFESYRTFPDYDIKGKRDTAYLGRFTFEMLKDHEALNRVFTILACGYMWETESPDVDRAYRALSAWCSLPEAVQPKRKKPGQSKTCFAELHAEFPELVDGHGAGWFYRHVHNIIDAVLDHTDKVTNGALDNVAILMDGFDSVWVKKVMQFQASIYSRKTEGWVTRFDDILADALETGGLQNKNFDLPAETEQMLIDAVPPGVPAYVLATLAKYYLANKPEDSDWVVLPVANFAAYFGTSSFDRKWLAMLPEEIIVRQNSAGVCRYRMLI